MNLLNGLMGGGGGHKGGGHSRNPLDVNGDGKVNILGKKKINQKIKINFNLIYWIY